MFRSRWKKVKKTNILEKMICIKIPLSLWMQCWSPRRRFPCSLREWHKTFTFFEKSSFYFSLIRSDGHEECSDYNLANVFSTKGRKCFPECNKNQKKTKNLKKLISIKFLLSRWMQCWPPRRNFPCSLQEWWKTYTFFEKTNFCFSSIRSDGHEECSDYKFAEEFLTKGRKFFPQSTKTLKKHIIQKIDLHKDPIVSVNAVLTTPPKHSLQSPRMIKNLYFFRNIHFLFFLNTFLWTRRMQWLQLRRRVFDERPKSFRSM